MLSARLPSSRVGMSGGEVVVGTFDSRVLKGNALGDPTKRDVAIYLPPKYDPTKRYPAAYGIVGYTGTGKMLLGVDPLGEDLASKLDRLIRTAKMGPMIVPLVDCFTRVGGEPNRRREEMYPILNTIGMAAHYSPNPRSKEMGIDFPFDLETGEWRPDVWERWRAWDPVNMVDRYAPRLRRLRLVYIDCGTQDQFNLIWGARTLHRKLLDRRIRHVYQEFEDTHSDIDYRYDVSLPLIWKALKA